MILSMVYSESSQFRVKLVLGFKTPSQTVLGQNRTLPCQYDLNFFSHGFSLFSHNFALFSHLCSEANMLEN